MRLSIAASVLTSLTLFVYAFPVAAQGTRKAPVVIPPLPSITPALPPLVRPTQGVPSRVSTKPMPTVGLIERLRTADTNDRSDIIWQLSDYQRKGVVPALVKALDDPDPLVKSGVAEALGNRTEEAIPAIPGLVAMVKDTRRAIVPKASFLALPRLYLAPPPLLSSETRREPPTPPQNPENLLRITAIVAIGKIGLPARTSATPPLTEALQDANPWVRLNATWALAEIGAQMPLLSHWLEALQSPDAELRRNAALIFQDERSLLRKALGAEADANTASQLVTTLKDDDPAVRDATGEAIALLGAAALPDLIKALKAPEPIVRFEAARLVGNLKSAAQLTVPDLITLLSDAGQYVPPGSNDSFGLVLPPPRYGSIYAQGEPENPDYLVRANAAIALGRVGNQQAIPALNTALKDENPWMQLATAWALQQLGQTEGLPVVGRLLQNPNPSVQSTALYQLKNYGLQTAPYIVPYLSPRLNLKDDNRRNEAIIDAGQFGAAALGLVPKLRTVLTSNQKNSSGYAATVLGNIAQSAAIAWRDGDLAESQRNQAIAELTKVLAIMEAPGARFNSPPVSNVRSALVTLKAPISIPLKSRDSQSSPPRISTP